jgi:hypothetical protein
MDLIFKQTVGQRQGNGDFYVAIVYPGIALHIQSDCGAVQDHLFENELRLFCLYPA